MHFNKSLSLVIIVSLLTSCSWLRDKPKTQKSFETSELNLTCLQEMPVQLQELFAGHYTESVKDQNSVKSIWSCLDHSLNTFSKYTRGSSAGSYSDQELLDFANRYLPNNNLFSAKLVNSIFKLKSSIIGGNENSITQNEILKLRAKLKKFGEIILPLSPYISTLLKPYENFTDDEMKIAGDRLNKFVADFAYLLEDSENTVKWVDISLFIGELEKYLNSSSPTSLTVVREQVEVFKYLKVLVVGGDEFGIEKTKWQPIFKSISSIYNAMYLNTSSADMMEQLSIEIQSTNEEQKNATQKLTDTLKVLKKNTTLYSKNTIELLSDRWSKALVLNSMLYPNRSNQLCIKNFLGSSKIRKYTANLIDELSQVKAGDQTVSLITKISENLSLLIQEVGINQEATLNADELREFNSKLKGLYKDDKGFQIIDSSIYLLEQISTILTGKDSKNLTPSDLKDLIEKSKDLYSAWKNDQSSDFNLALSNSLKIIIRKPFASSISIDQIQELIRTSKNIFTKMEFTTTIDWDHISDLATKAAKLKAVLFGNTDKTINNTELTQISSTWDAFGSYVEIDDALESLSKYFKKNPYATVKTNDLLNAIDAFLPDDQKLSKLGISIDQVGYLKAFLVGGARNTIDRSEYTKISQVGFTIYRSLKPVLKSLPNDFKIGLNASSFALFEAGLQGLISGKNFKFSNNALKQLLLFELNKAGYNVHPITIDKLLIGINHRIFDHNTGKKPIIYPDYFDSSKLIGMKEFFQKTKLDYLDFEKAFNGISESNSLPSNQIKERLNSTSARNILSILHPIMSGQTNMPYFTGNNKPQIDYYQIDLKYKSLIYNVLIWVFPKYEIEEDNLNLDKLPRLSLLDLTDLFDDVSDTVYELGLSFSPDTAIKSATKRMQSINLFTRTGNGDEYIDVVETVDFLTTTFAGKNLLDEVRRKLVKNCYTQNLSYSTQTTFSYSCLKNQFFGINQFKDTYLKVIPQMTKHYLGLSVNEKELFISSTLTASKSGWTEQTQFNLDDLETLVSIPYYVENIFLRLDLNLDGLLNFTEAMNGFPIFCKEIKKAGGDSIKGSCEKGEKPRQIEAIFGHLLMKGVAPSSIEPNDSWMEKLKKGKDFLLWLYYWNHLNRDPEVRDISPPYLYRKDLLNIISNLSTSITLPPSPLQPLSNDPFVVTPLSDGQSE